MSPDVTASRTAFIQALAAGDEAAARTVVQRLQSANVPAEAIYYAVFAPSMVMIGDLWERNELTVAEEHLATAITERLIGQLSSAFSQFAHRTERGSVVLGCVAGERHVLGLRMLADLFRQQGWRVLHLGADVPSADFVRLALRVNADVVAISASTPGHIPAVSTLIEEIQTVLPQVDIVVGGAVFANHPNLWQQVGATLFDPDPRAAVMRVTARFKPQATQPTS